MEIPRPSARHLLLLLTLCGAAYGAMHGIDDDGIVSMPEARAKRMNPAAQPAAEMRNAASVAPLPAELALPQRNGLEQAPQADLFAVTSWLPPVPPPPPPAKAPPPPPPSAPPLPFHFVGLLEDQAKPTAFLSRGDALHVVTAGQVLDEVYRIESVTPAEIVITYLPLRQRQTLAVSGASS